MTPLRSILAIFSATLISAPTMSFAESDIELGEKTFKKCRSCHAIVSPEGEVIQKGGRTGPNLYGLPGRQAGTVDGFRYGASLIDAGEGGLRWEEDSFIAYTADPRAFLREITQDNAARSKMAFRLKKDAEHVYAYIASVSAAQAAD